MILLDPPRSPAPAPPRSTVATALRAFRQTLRMTQEELAHEVGVTVSTINRWERGHARPWRVFRRALERLAAERGVALEFPAD